MVVGILFPGPSSGALAALAGPELPGRDLDVRLIDWVDDAAVRQAK